MNRIGKPQKTSKHKKLKACDPFYKGPRPKTKDQNLVNQRPKNDDEQEIPNSLKEIMRARQQLKKNPQGNKKKNKNKFKDFNENKMLKGMTRPLKPVPDFSQGKYETDRFHLARVNRQTDDLIAKRHMEEKYEIDIEEKPSGAVVLHNRSIKDNLDTPENSKISSKRRRLDEFHDKKKDQKRKKKDEEGGFEALTDKVSFGEVVMEPPSITAKPRNARVKEKSSKIKSLKLNELSKPDDEDSQDTTQKPKDKTKIGTAKKRKHLAPAEKIKADMRREEAIAMYRQIKKKKVPTATLR